VSKITTALLMALVTVFAIRAPFIFLLIYIGSIFAIPVIALLVGLASALIISLLLLKRAAGV